MRDIDENLIFLISLPRSGSTLLQHILANHPRIGATAEPWILFPAAYALRKGALSADYNAEIGRIALSEFLSRLDDGEEQYYSAVRRMALELYNAFLTGHGKEIFLDKTSRYYLILPELFRIFPKAKYVFLLRNPLAVFASYLESMVFGNWKRLGEPGIRNDLLDGFRLMRQGIRYHGDDAIIVKYEELVDKPEAVISQLCNKLELDFDPIILNYGDMGLLPGKLVDPKSIHKHSAPVKDYLHAWKSKLTSRQEKHFAYSFITHLGPELVNSLGYSYDELEAFVSKEDRGWTPVIRWDILMTHPDKRSRLQKYHIDLIYIYRKQGVMPLIKYMMSNIYNLFFKTLKTAMNILRGHNKHATIMKPVKGFVNGARQCLNPSLNIKGRAASANYRVIDQSQISQELLDGWRANSVAERQGAAYEPLLKDMRQGNPRKDFIIAGQALRLTDLPDSPILEIGCGNGYYSEVLSYLSSCPIKYTGLDFSRAMIKSARERYPERQFILGEATILPFKDNSYDVVWSGTIIMHLADYDKSIEETVRVARRFCVFHSTPLVSDAPTTFLTKDAYGAPVFEVILNLAEFETLLHNSGLVIRHILESLPYKAGAAFDGTMRTLTYVCEKLGVR